MICDAAGDITGVASEAGVAAIFGGAAAAGVAAVLLVHSIIAPSIRGDNKAKIVAKIGKKL